MVGGNRGSPAAAHSLAHHPYAHGATVERQCRRAQVPARVVTRTSARLPGASTTSVRASWGAEAAGVDAEQPQVLAVKAQPQVPGDARVDDPPALPLPGRAVQLRGGPGR